MLRNDQLNRAMPEDVSASKKGISIRSIMAIMTLVAVWFAIPPTVSVGQWSEQALTFFVLVHHLSLWVLVGSILWIVTGRRRLVVALIAGFWLIAWAPLIIITFERVFLNSEHITAWTVRSGMVKVLDPFYNSVFESFSYRPEQP